MYPVRKNEFEVSSVIKDDMNGWSAKHYEFKRSLLF